MIIRPVHCLGDNFRRYRPQAVLLFGVGLLIGGCQRMQDQAKYEPLEYSDFYPGGQSARPLVKGTVARGHLRLDEHLYEGTVAGEPAETFPFEITRADLERGRERYNIFCSVCHGLTGEGDGMVVQRGFVPPPSYHIPRLREEPVGHFYDVMTNGWGAMYSYSDRVTPEDRWRIAAYIRALQLSQHAGVDQLTEEERRKLTQQP